MQLLRQLWVDEQGAVLSAEVATVATVGVMGTVVGLNTMTDAVNGELRDMSQSFRSLDQSYRVQGFRGCRSWSAGSCFQQRSVEETPRDMPGPHRPQDWDNRLVPSAGDRSAPELKPQPVPSEAPPRDAKPDSEAEKIESTETPASDKL